MQNQVNETTSRLDRFWDGVIESLPDILGAIIIILIGWIIAKIVAGALRKTLTKINLNNKVHSTQGGSIIHRAVPDPTNLFSNITYWVIFLFAVSIAISALGIPALEGLVNDIYTYIPNIIAAIVIFLVAGAVSGAAATLASNTMGHTPTGKVVATGVPFVVMGIAIFMILNQLRIAPEIVTITYAGIVATATLAFGLGGKDAASRMFMTMYETGQKKRDPVARDLKEGSKNAKAKARDLKNKA